MTPKQRERLIQELKANGYVYTNEIVPIVEKVLKEEEEKCQACKDGIPKTWLVRHTCHTPPPAKVELPEKIPEKINETLALNYLTLRNKINELIDYLSAQSSPE